MDFLNPRAITAELQASDKEGVIRELVSLLVKARLIKDKTKLVKTLMNREALGSTGIEQGVGILPGWE